MDWSEHSPLNGELISVDFEVFGKVQGVSYRKYAVAAAEKFNVRGWCKNTAKGSVRGNIEGPKAQVYLMKDWIRNEGSPYSKTESVEFGMEINIPSYKYTDFSSMEEEDKEEEN
ncbi:Hypothetical predicted protein [Cloeon dipterum]|uniref:acylphosphatase n=1 Tax=Cloeon dipterum TaxID=197152 RepID=A0A8S1CMV2_9INSE|nr:Hypothetical predicted protein [Cloeon dipterum]